MFQSQKQSIQFKSWSKRTKQLLKGNTIPCLHHIKMCDLPQGMWGFGVESHRSNPSLHQRS